MHTLSALRGYAGVAVGLTLLALAITVFATLVLWQLRRDRSVLQVQRDSSKWIRPAS